jgi:hypothetical protein
MAFMGRRRGETDAAARLLNAASPGTTLENAVIVQRKNSGRAATMVSSAQQFPLNLKFAHDSSRSFGPVRIDAEYAARANWLGKGIGDT